MRTMVNSKLGGIATPNLSLTTRKMINVIQVYKVNMSATSTKKANLFATKKERIKLPNYDELGNGKAYHIREFLNQPSGIEAMLNTSAFESFQSLDTHTYRCTLPKVKLINFEVAPILDLRVTPTHEDCTVEMLSCKFEGSKLVESQNDRFSAFMKNHVTWYTTDYESFLELDIKLNVTLEIYTRAFALLPKSAIESPGNLMMQALVDRLVELLLQQLLQDYENWIRQQYESLQ